MNNVFTLPFEDLAELNDDDIINQRKVLVSEEMGRINDFCESQGIDISTNEYRHQAAIIMTQLQIILMGIK